MTRRHCAVEPTCRCEEAWSVPPAAGSGAGGRGLDAGRLRAVLAGSGGGQDSESAAGDSGLREVRTTRTLAPGVDLTGIVRGTHKAKRSEIDTTSQGPWRVQVLSIDPATVHGHLATTYGDDVADTDRTTELTHMTDAVVGANASFFLAKSDYPGDPVGLAVHAGDVVSEPTAVSSPEADVLIDSATNRLSYGHLSWRGSLRNRTTHATLGLRHLNHPPAVPAACAELEDPTACPRTGDVSSFTRAFASHTPEGPGAEVILDSSGCVVHRATTRGRALGDTQRSVQATGRQARTLLSMSRRGCLRTSVSLHRGTERVKVTPSLFAVNGRYQLVRDGRAQVPTGHGGIFDRNPRTFIGSTRHGVIMIVTVDGRRTTSVGTTISETAAVARSLGLVDAVNLDGGGSTTMAVGSKLVNRPSGDKERSVGDALVYTEQAEDRVRTATPRRP